MKFKILIVFLLVGAALLGWINFSGKSETVKYDEMIKGYALAQEVCYERLGKFCSPDEVGFRLPDSCKVYFDEKDVPKDLMSKIPREDIPTEERGTYKYAISCFDKRDLLWVIARGREPRLIN